jgi:pPIWI RE three-gene island domain Z
VRDRPGLWDGDERIQWACMLMQQLDEESLEHLTVVLSGLRSVERSAQAVSHVKEIETARAILGDLRTRRAVQSAVFDFQMSETANRSFDIDAATLRFRQVADYDPNVTRARQILTNGLPTKVYTRKFADSSKHLEARLAADRRIRLRLNGLQFRPPEQHNLDRRPVGRITVHWDELRALADDLEKTDREAGRRTGRWRRPLENAILYRTGGLGLREYDELALDGLVHLIGLPGAGKTTLITLLCILLARRGLRVAVFFTAIQVAREYLETLRRYLNADGKRVAMIMGRSADTHRRHANQLAELIAAQGEGGFGRWRDGADLLAQSCALLAFSDDWPSDSEWAAGEAPCESLYEPGGGRSKLCPAWSLCGRVKNQRELVGANVWLGHILSADTLVPAHTCNEQLRYFELAARTFDLVIVDETDDTQSVLDARGALPLTLTGDDGSVHSSLQQTAGLLAANRAHVSDRKLRYIQYANEFERHTLRFVAEIRRLQRDAKALADAYAEKLLTTSFLLREAEETAGSRVKLDARAHSALLDLWESAMYGAYFDRDADGTWRKAKRLAPALGLTIEEGVAAWQQLNRSFRRYLALDHAAAAEQPIADGIEVLSQVIGAREPAALTPHVRLLVAVGFTIASYQRVAKFARALIQLGELEADDRFFAKASPELRALVPRSILGTFSSIRYRVASETGGLEIDYLVVDSTPRLLLHRLHEIGGASVLLASATSWLEPASQYHVNRTPDYVLSPREPQLGRMRLALLPKLDPIRKKPLRFSGGGYEREANLRAMVEQLGQRGPGGSSDLERTVLSSRTPIGRARKAALVVNSYEQVELVVEQLCAVNPELGERTRGVLRDTPTRALQGHYVLRGQVEALGADPEVDILVFPLGALGRGVNIVFDGDDQDNGRASIGSVFFLTRPHPAAGDLGLMLSLLARETELLDAEDLSTLELSDVARLYDERRYAVFRRVARLLARPMIASQLDDETLEAFAANLLVAVLQTIGRGMRRGMPVEVYFVDAAWAPESAEGRPDTKRSSVLVGMREVLLDCLNAADSVKQAIYRAVYGPFEAGFRDIDGLAIVPATATEVDDDLRPSTAGLEDAMDDFDPDAEAVPVPERHEPDQLEELLDTPLEDEAPSDEEDDAAATAAWAEYERGQSRTLDTTRAEIAMDTLESRASEERRMA